MTTRARHLTTAVVFLILTAGPTGTAIADSESRVRTFSPIVSALIQRATDRSETFRSLINTIEVSDGIVRVEHGTCPNRARGCLLWAMTVSGPDRVLSILVDTSTPGDSLAGVIGHELAHAIEVLNNRAIRTNAAMNLLYRRIGTSRGHAFETDAAIRAGNTVRKEMKRSR